MRQQRAHEKQPDLFHPKQADTQLRPEECSELLPLVQHLLAGILSIQSSVRAVGERGDE
jgi:hypothetical protein